MAMMPDPSSSFLLSFHLLIGYSSLSCPSKTFINVTNSIGWSLLNLPKSGLWAAPEGCRSVGPVFHPGPRAEVVEICDIFWVFEVNFHGIS